MKAGELQPDGTYEEGSFFRKVDDRLRAMIEIVRKFGKEEEGPKGETKEESSGCDSCRK
jgi:hypothetical protein